MKLQVLKENIFTIENFWTIQKCEHFITKSEDIGYRPATVKTERGQRLVPSVRNNNRVIYKDDMLAGEIWKSLEPFATQQIGYSKAVGLNELFRFYRYEPGQEFKRHRDQSYIRDNGEASYYTFMIYLNDDYDGGETTFNDLIIKPQTGLALIFFHNLEHEGSPVKSGAKYVLRTDIMFRLDE
ncbi:MAG: prolyl hydroxylase family protein [Mucilaginibacter sp.]